MEEVKDNQENNKIRPENVENQTGIIDSPEINNSEKEVESPTLAEEKFDSILSIDEDNSEIKKNSESKEVEEMKKEENIRPTDIPSKSNANTKNIIIGILVVLVIVLAWLWQGTLRNSNILDKQKNNDTVVVSDRKEQGTVRIVERGDSNLGINNSTLLNENQVGITAYFGNTQENKNMTDCSIVFPLDRVIEKKYDSSMINAVKGLLQPLNSEELARGFLSSVPSGTTLKYVRISNGVVEVNFSAELNKIAGSCAVSAVRAQIEKTLLQFPEVKLVKICVEGNCSQDTILQP